MATLHLPPAYPKETELLAFLKEAGLTTSSLPGCSSLRLEGDTASLDLSPFPEAVLLSGEDGRFRRPTLWFPFRPEAVSYTPPQLAKIYGMPLPDKEVTVALVELGGGYREADLDAYWSSLRIAPPTVVSVPVDGVDNAPGSEADGEVVLDIEVVGGIAPGCKILVFFAPNSERGFYDAIAAALAASPDTISISWGGPEDTWDPATLRAFDSLFAQAAEKGITVCVASGDNGASDGEKGLHVDFPASSPSVLACGGTTLSCPNGIYDGETKEVCWGTYSFFGKGGGGGGGFSSLFSAPDYQKELGLEKRGVPDVCGVADPRTGWQIFLDGREQVVGGTSAVAPMWAAYLALSGQKSFVNPLLYQNAAAFHDIAAGNNEGYRAKKGWDPATGLGSPNGTLLNPILSKRT